MNELNIDQARAKFPALALKDDGMARVYFDGPAGTQVPQQVLDRMQTAMIATNANLGGHFSTTLAAEVLVDEAHSAVAAFYNAASAKEIIFGQSMSALTFNLSRSLARQFNPGDEIVLSRMDHDANVAPWLLMAQDRDLSVRWLDFDNETYEFANDALDKVVSDKTRLVAFGYASNCTGTINDVAALCAKAHQAGALSFVDAVQFAPHGVIDVQGLGCDFLVSSSYKWFGPHQGILWGREDLLGDLHAYQVRPAQNALPDKFELGTTPRESLAGVMGALDYIASIGQNQPAAITRENLVRGMAVLETYERHLCQHLIAGLLEIPGLKIHGITAHNALSRRVPTVSFTLSNHNPDVVAKKLAAHNIFVWSGHNYALEPINKLGLMESGGVVRVGPVHYNTTSEIDQLIAIVAKLATE